jgi:hypothetical protein
MPLAAVFVDITEHLHSKRFGTQAPSALHRLELLFLFTCSPGFHQ